MSESVRESVPVTEGSIRTPMVRIIDMDQPWKWLQAGWRDTLRTLVPSVLYGLIFVVMGYVLIYMIGTKFYLALAVTTGFLLVGPFLATGIYDLSKRLEEGKSATIFHALFAWRGNTMAILLFGILIGLIMIVWARLSALMFAVIVDTSDVLVVSNQSAELFFSGAGLSFLLVFATIGGVLAFLVYGISAVSIPMMVDRNTDFITAVLTSLKAVSVNKGPMILWAGLIVVFTGIGLVTFYIGLAITLPLIGHATWHAYRALVESDADLSPAGSV